jgi:hypothetical protein
VSSDDVRVFLDGLTPDAREIVVALRKAVVRTAPDAEETLLWGGLSYHTPWIGGRVKGALCQITAKRGEVRLEFIHGVRLADPEGLLRGDRLSKRFVPIRSVADAQRSEIVALLREAATIEFSPGA